MRAVDALLVLLLPSLILLHLLVAPYTKVEESFNIQATHDILSYGTPIRNISAQIGQHYDHVSFPGAVPRSFVGPLFLSGIARPCIAFFGENHAQLIVRAVLGFINVAALLRYSWGVSQAFGWTTGRWWILLIAGQFHVLFYASRTLPNSFAFGLSTLALTEFLPKPTTASDLIQQQKHFRLGISLLVFAGIIFRAELAILLLSHLAFFYFGGQLSLIIILSAGLRSALVALTLSVTVDSYFWLRPLWPELEGFIFNAIQGKSAEWGTEPFSAYFTTYLPKLLLNPVILFILFPLSIYLPSVRPTTAALRLPALLFVSIYSFQPHKEARFIIYVVPPLTACAAVAASYVTTHRSRSVLYRILFLLISASIPLSLMLSTGMLLISSLNYPGGEALYRLHQHILDDVKGMNDTQHFKVHIDVPAAMTGVTLFQQAHPSPPVYDRLHNAFYSTTSETVKPLTPSLVAYDKMENETFLHSPQFWSTFDYILSADPALAIGNWDVIETVYGYAGLKLLRPGQDHSAQTWEEQVGEIYTHALHEKQSALVASDTNTEPGSPETTLPSKGTGTEHVSGAARYLLALPDWVRPYTRGWYVGPRLEAKIWVLRRAGLLEGIKIGRNLKTGTTVPE